MFVVQLKCKKSQNRILSVATYDTASGNAPRGGGNARGEGVNAQHALTSG